jgi:WD40 repeat protein
MAAASSGTGLRAWTASGDPAWSLEDSESRILNIAANEAYLAVAHQSGILEVLELGDSQPQLHRQLRLPPPADKLTPYRAVLDWNRMGTRLASALEHSPEVLIWEAGTDRSWTIRVDHREGILNLSMSTDGTRLFTTSYDAAAALWDVDTGRSLARFSGQLSAFGSGAISPDNSRVALGGNDGTLSICDAESGQEMARFPALNGFINFVAWDDRGDALMTASTDSMRIFRAPAWQQILVTKSLPKQTPSNSRDDNILQSGSR